jgi:hypothetical protein
MWCFMFNSLDVHSILIFLDQFYSLSNVILILIFHKMIEVQELFYEILKLKLN